MGFSGSGPLHFEHSLKSSEQHALPNGPGSTMSKAEPVGAQVGLSVESTESATEGMPLSSLDGLSLVAFEGIKLGALDG